MEAKTSLDKQSTDNSWWNKATNLWDGVSNVGSKVTTAAASTASFAYYAGTGAASIVSGTVVGAASLAVGTVKVLKEDGLLKAGKFAIEGGMIGIFGTYVNWVYTGLNSTQQAAIDRVTQKISGPILAMLQQAGCPFTTNSKFIHQLENGLKMRLAAAVTLAVDYNAASTINKDDAEAISGLSDWITELILPTENDQLGDMFLSLIDKKIVDTIGSDTIDKIIQEVVKDPDIIALLKQSLGVRIGDFLIQVGGGNSARKGVFGRAISKIFVLAEKNLANRRTELLEVCAQHQHLELLNTTLASYIRSLKQYLRTQAENTEAQLTPSELQAIFLDSFLEGKDIKALEAALRFKYGPDLEDNELIDDFFTQTLSATLLKDGLTALQLADAVDSDFQAKVDEIEAKEKKLFENSFKSIADELCKIAGVDANKLWEVLSNMGLTSRLLDFSNYTGLTSRIHGSEIEINHQWIYDRVKDLYLPRLLLKAYSESMKGPNKEEGLIEELQKIMFKGQTIRDDYVLPEGPGEGIREGENYKELLLQDASIDWLSEFITGLLDVVSDDITDAVRNYLKNPSPDEEGNIDPLFYALGQIASSSDKVLKGPLAFVSEHIKIQLLKAFVSISNKNTDDVAATENGKDNKSLIGQLLINLNQVWDKHKDSIHEKIAIWKSMPQEDLETEQYFNTIFIAFTKDLLDIAGIDFFEELPMLTPEAKAVLMHKTMTQILPNTFGNIYLGLTQWESERIANEEKLAEYSSYAPGTLGVVSRFATEALQSYLAQNPRDVGEGAQESLIAYFKSKKTQTGDKLAQTLADNTKQVVAVAQSNLPAIAADQSLWDNVDSGIRPVVVKLFTNLTDKVEEIEKRENSLFMRETGLEVLKLVNSHVGKINQVKSDLKYSNATSIDRQELFNEVAKVSTTGVMSNKIYVKAKNAFITAQKELDAAKENLGYWGRAKKWLHVGDGTEAARKRYSAAKGALRAANKEYEKARKEQICIPMAHELLDVLGMKSAKDLPLPAELEGIRELVWDLVRNNLTPTLLNIAHHSLSDGHTLNQLMITTLNTMVNSLQVPKENPNDKAVRRHLKLVAGAKSKMPNAAKIAEQALNEVKNGVAVTKAIRDVLTDESISDVDKDFFKTVMINPPPKPILLADPKTYEWNDENLAFYQEIIDPDQLSNYAELRKRIQDFDNVNMVLDDAGKIDAFNSEVGQLVKGFVDLLPGIAKHFVGIHAVQKLTSETVGESVRSQLEKQSLHEIINTLMESAGPALLAGSKWVDDPDRVDANGNPIKRLERTHATLNSESTTEFDLPITKKAKRAYDAKQAAEQRKVAIEERNLFISVLGIEVRALVLNSIKSYWKSFVNSIYKLIDYLCPDGAEAVKNSFNKWVSFFLEKMVGKIANILIEPIVWICRKIAEWTWFLYPKHVDDINAGIHMPIHEELIWDVMALGISQLRKHA